MLVFITSACNKPAGNIFTAHSHNDYRQQRPFYLAHEQYCASIEADIWYMNDQLFVAHDFEEINKERTIEALYFEPIASVFEQNGGRAWKDHDQRLILLIDLKTGYDSTLTALLEALEPYKHLFDPEMNQYAVKIVISGNMPDPDLFDNYPEFISFDGRMENRYTKKQLERIALFSNSIGDYVSRDFRGHLSKEDRSKLSKYIKTAHSLNKKVRFWGIPDDPAVWKQLKKMGVDLINTDTPAEYMQTMSK